MSRTEELWRELRAPLAAFVRRRVANAQDAEDLVAEVFLKLHERADELEHVRDARAWLHQVARRAIVDHYRRTRADVPFDEAHDAPAPNDEDDAAELAGCMERMMQSLGDEDRRALQAVAAGHSQDELADREGISPTGARSRVQRARTRLIDAFRACCRIEFDGVGRIVDWQRREPPGGCRPTC